MNGEMTAHERVQIARHPQRPGVRDYIDALFPHFFELRGDRLCGEDEAIAVQLRELMKQQGKALAEQRYQKFRRMSAFERAELVRQPAARQENQP
ncbi:MAG: hypothetical protein ACI4O4_08715 [Candidatus Ventricola sp.]